MTRDDAIAQISASTKLTPSDVEDLLACSEPELRELVAAYRDADKMPGPDAWTVVLDILKVCGEVAGVVIPLTGAIQGVFGIVAAIK